MPSLFMKKFHLEGWARQGRNKPLSRRDSTAFTLVELLTVIAIVAVLAGLAIAGLQKTSATARKMKCVSNLRQIGIANQSYASDNNGVIVPSRLGGGGNLYWPYLLASYMGSTAPSAGAAGSADNTVFTCPEKKATATGATQMNIGVFAVRYMINSHIANVIDLSSASSNVCREGRMMQMKPAKTALMMDGIQGLGFFSFVSSALTYPHQNTVNVLYLDGHVEAKNSQEMAYYAQYPFHIFWRGYDWGAGGYKEE